jgi:fructose-1,6-bisphosphatase I
MDCSGLQTCFIKISELLRYGDLQDLGKDCNVNSSLDKVKEIDIIANNIIIGFANSTENIVGYISEENTHVVFKDNIESRKNTNSKNYILAFDPLDGSKNVGSNITSGTLYCLLEYDIENDKVISVEEAGYCIYGAKTVMLIAKRFDVKLYELDRNNKFNFIKKIYKIPQGKIYHCNESYSNIYDEDVKILMKHFKNNDYSLRYVGSIVADCHQIISEGGIFIYSNNKKYPEGKIRYYYEALPLSFIFSQIQGVGLDLNFKDILSNLKKVNLTKEYIHKRIPIILCNKIDSEYMQNILSINQDNYC